MARGLDYAHVRNIVHRDVKAANIMVQHDGTVKLVDFGIANLPGAERLTATGMVEGTLDCFSPEQAKTEPITGHSDQFSLAMMAYRIFTGRKPFQAENDYGTLHRIINEDSHPSGLNAGADSVLRRALSKNPPDRFVNCAEFVAHLAKALTPRQEAPTIILPRFDAVPVAREKRVNPIDELTYV